MRQGDGKLARRHVTDSAGKMTEYSHFACSENGAYAFPLQLAWSDEAGPWSLRIHDLTAGLLVEKPIKVVD